MADRSTRTRTRCVRPAGLVAALAVALGAPGIASAATTTVDAGARGEARQQAFAEAQAEANAFFRRTVTIRRGDRVRWRINGFHTVTFVPRGNPQQPFGLAQAENPVTGVLDAAGNPFWFNGQPRAVVNPLVAFPRGGDTFRPARLHSSGLPAEEGPPEPYVLRFRRKGTFRYYCAVHPRMRGTVRVVGRRQPIPTHAENRAAARRAQNTILRRVQSLTTGVGTSGLEDTLQAGNDDRQGSAIYKFFPARKTIAAGTTLTLRMSPRSTEDHTFSFGPTNGRDAYLDQLAQRLVTPLPSDTGPPTLLLEPRVIYPSEPPPAGVPSLTPTLHGNGFLNTGFLNRNADDPFPASYRVRFPTAGTYTYICLIHPQMRGTVTVTP